MPFINGRYHVNPIMGEALEAAREAEAALVALQQQASRYSADYDGRAPYDNSADPDDPSSADAPAGAGPIHHVEIEVTQEGLPGRRLVEPGRSIPSSSGRSTRGFVARVHRASYSDGGNSSQSAGRAEAPPETHVFSDHRDLVNFLRDSLAPKYSPR
jgi:hypothetical protein